LPFRFPPFQNLKRKLLKIKKGHKAKSLCGLISYKNFRNFINNDIFFKKSQNAFDGRNILDMQNYLTSDFGQAGMP